MEYVIVFAPWVICVVLFVLLRKEKQYRADDWRHASDRIEAAEKRAQNEIETSEKRFQNEIDTIKKGADTQIKLARDQAQVELLDMHKKTEQRIRMERESMLADKEILLPLTEKELLIECMSALRLYAQRLDRIENRISGIAIGANTVVQKAKAEKIPYTYSGGITDDEFLSIAREAAKHIDRITELTVEDAEIFGLVRSQQKTSTWSFSIDFNDNGRMTGQYRVFSENDDSTIPQRLAKEIAKEIVYRISQQNAI